MTVECFLDTNVLVYAAAGRGPDEWKRSRAFEIMESINFGISGQVLQEFFVTVTRKIKVPLPVIDAVEWVDRLALREVAPVDESLVKTAILISRRYEISYWDGAIIAAAQTLDTRTIYTEDLNHGQVYQDIRVINPFRPH